jgi:hypothetical protein
MYDPVGTPVFGTNTRVDPPPTEMAPSSAGYIEAVVPSTYFRPHHYLFSLWLGDYYQDYCMLDKALQVELRDDTPRSHPQDSGSLCVPVRWNYRAAIVDPQTKKSVTLPT